MRRVWKNVRVTAVSVQIDSSLGAGLRKLTRRSNGAVSKIIGRTLKSVINDPHPSCPRRVTPLAVKPIGHLVLHSRRLVLTTLTRGGGSARCRRHGTRVFRGNCIHRCPRIFTTLLPRVPGTHYRRLCSVLSVFHILETSCRSLPRGKETRIGRHSVSPRNFSCGSVRRNQLTKCVGCLFTSKHCRRLTRPLEGCSSNNGSRNPQLRVCQQVLQYFGPF